MKCAGCDKLVKNLKNGAVCSVCFENEALILLKLTEKYGEKRGQLLFMGYPITILELDDELIEYTFDVMMENLRNELG